MTNIAKICLCLLLFSIHSTAQAGNSTAALTVDFKGLPQLRNLISKINSDRFIVLGCEHSQKVFKYKIDSEKNTVELRISCQDSSK